MTLRLDSLIPSCASVSRLGGWTDGWMDERVDRWPVCWRREGRRGWSELLLEMEKKNKGDINLAQRSLSAPVFPPRGSGAARLSGGTGKTR